MISYRVLSTAGWRTWMADDAEHAREQHDDAFPDEDVLRIQIDTTS